MTSASIGDPQADRSVLRALRKSGDLSRDGRGRVSTMPPILQYGFRPFFFLAATYAGAAIPVWLWLYFSGQALPGPFPGLHWHAHEMLFGYLQAVLAGFVLTAIPNWTGRLPLSGWPLAGLVSLWLAGRVACAAAPDPAAAFLVDISFPMVLGLAVWREVIAGRNWKNTPVAVMITLFGLANALGHAANLGFVPQDLGVRLALGAIAMLLALIGGRIVPSFTRNWLVKNGASHLPASFGTLDKAALRRHGRRRGCVGRGPRVACRRHHARPCWISSNGASRTLARSPHDARADRPDPACWVRMAWTRALAPRRLGAP